MGLIVDAVDDISKSIDANAKKKPTIAECLNELAGVLGSDKESSGNIYEALRNVKEAFGSGGIGGGAAAQLLARNVSEVTDSSGEVKVLGDYAFYRYSSLTSLTLAGCENIGSSAFQNCSSLTSVNFPVCTTVGNSAFYGCTSLTTANFPVCTIIGNNAFTNCSSLTSVSFPACTNIGGTAFTGCFSLTEANFPVCTSIGNTAFQNCSSLTSVNFPACTSIGENAFYSCRKLLSLYLLGSSVCTLQNSNAFTSTPIAGYTTSTNGVYGSIYVPASLYNSYKTATNWSYFADRFVSIA